MAGIVVIASGMLGFVTGLMSLFLGLGFLAAIGLWFAIGLSAAGMVASFAILPRRQQVAQEA